MSSKKDEFDRCEFVVAKDEEKGKVALCRDMLYCRVCCYCSKHCVDHVGLKAGVLEACQNKKIAVFTVPS